MTYGYCFVFRRNTGCTQRLKGLQGQTGGAVSCDGHAGTLDDKTFRLRLHLGNEY